MKYIDYIIMESIFFFINGNLQVLKTGSVMNPKYRYIMRFLTESEYKNEATPLIISVVDNKENRFDYEVEVNGVTLVKIDVTRFIEDYNYQNSNYIRLSYAVYHEEDSKALYRGSFPIINHYFQDFLDYQVVSNCLFDGNRMGIMYSILKDRQQKDKTNRNIDLLLHLGNQINGNACYDNRADKQRTTNKFRELYRQLYSNNQLGPLLRQCLNVMALNNYDIHSKFGNLDSIKMRRDNLLSSHYEAGMTMYLQYQYQLAFDIEDRELEENKDDDVKLESDDETSIYVVTDHGVTTQENYIPSLNIKAILNGTSRLYNSFEIGSYKFVLLDERNETYHKNILFSNEQLDWLQDTILNSDPVDIRILSVRPIGHMSRNNALVMGFFFSRGKDDLNHPLNQPRTIRLLNILSGNHGKNITLFCGDVNYLYRNAIIYDDRIISNQYVNGIGRSILNEQVTQWFDRIHSQFLSSISRPKIGNYLTSRKFSLNNLNNINL